MHTLHTYGFSPVWVLKWTFKLICWLKVLWQIEHSNGFSPVCTRTCLCKSHDCGNIFPQNEQGCQSWEDNFLIVSKEAAGQLSLDVAPRRQNATVETHNFNLLLMDIFYFEEFHKENFKHVFNECIKL